MKQAVATKESVLIDEWTGCYRGGWKGVIVDEAFSHPAKVAFNLAKRIYEHAIDFGWIHPDDVVVDPFGGIGGCAFHGLMSGMRVVTCELEEKFVNLSKQNRELWRKQYTGLPGFNADKWIILQGDSRKLVSLVSEAGLSVSSPPYSGSQVNPGNVGNETNKRWGGEASLSNHSTDGYGTSAGQLGTMKEGDLSLAISSPPYIESLKPETEEQTERKQRRIAESKTIYDGRKMEEPSAGKAGLGGGYGTTEGNLGAMPAGDLCVSSPPYAVVSPEKNSRSIDYQKQYETYRSQGGGASFEKFLATQELHSQGYGSSDGQLSALKDSGFNAAISSPPYEASTHVNNSDAMTAGPARWAGGKDSGARVKQDYADYSAQNMGNQTGDTFWSASRVILEQLYSVLSPGAHAIFIVKAFVRDKKIVDFPGQWTQLCEAVGFKLIHDHHALLTEHSGTQGGFFGEDKEHKVKRVSFFRRLHEKKSPETAIEYENVLCFEK